MADRDSDGPLGTAREEAERLIAAALAAASFAARQGRRVAGARDSRDRANRERADREGRPRSTGGPDLAGLAGLAGRFLSDWGKDPERDDSSPFGSKSGADRYDVSGRDFAGDEPQHGRWRVATGSEACCVCPICRAIDAVRDPSPELMEKLASGASDLAAAATTILRTVGDVTNRIRRPAEDAPRGAGRTEEPDERPEEDWTETLTVVIQRDEPAAAPTFADGADFSSIWQSATRAPTTEPPRRAPHTPKPMAKKAVRGPASPPPAGSESGPDDAEPALPARPATKKNGRAETANTAPAESAGKTTAKPAGTTAPAKPAGKKAAVPAGKKAAAPAGKKAAAAPRAGARTSAATTAGNGRAAKVAGAKTTAAKSVGTKKASTKAAAPRTATKSTTATEPAAVKAAKAAKRAGGSGTDRAR